MTRFLIVLMMMSACGIFVFAQNESQFGERNRLLEAEIGLAKAPGTYMVIDIEGRSVSLKARGMVLRKWSIKKAKTWGKAVPLDVYKMERKSALSEPERPNITPVKDEKGTPDEETKDVLDLGVLELKDMPIHFSLHFGKDIHVSIRPRTRRFWPVLVNIGKSISWHTVLPLKTLWFAVRKKAFTEIELVLPSEKDAQGIYWSFLDGQKTLIVQRRS